MKSSPDVITVYGMDPCCTVDDVGFIPTFLDLDDKASAAEQFDAKYIGGWHNQPKVSIDDKFVMHYPGDPPLKPLAYIPFRTERIFVYPYAFVVIMQADGSFESCRMD